MTIQENKMKIKQIICGPLEANGYIIYTDESREAFIIDPGYSHKKYTSFINDEGLNVKGILLTHHHPDHSGKADILASEFDCQIYMHRGELPYYKGRVDIVLEGDEILTFGDEALKVIHTPGHSTGGVCFYSEKSKLAFTGDTVFSVEIGYSHFPGGSLQQMTDSINNIINKWENDIKIYPGHGGSSLMKYVKKDNPEFIELLI